MIQKTSVTSGTLAAYRSTASVIFLPGRASGSLPQAQRPRVLIRSGQKRITHKACGLSALRCTVDTIRPRSAPARRGLNRIDGNAPVTRRPDSYFSYLKERATLVRNADTFPFLTVMSILVTSAMRRSRMDFAAGFDGALGGVFPGNGADTDDIYNPVDSVLFVFRHCYLPRFRCYGRRTSRLIKQIVCDRLAMRPKASVFGPGLDGKADEAR